MDASNSIANDKSKTDSLLQQFFSKTAQVIIQSRLHNPNTNKRNKWVCKSNQFNLELFDNDLLREELRFYKQQLTAKQSPPMIIDILLDLNDSQLLINSNGRKTRISNELMGEVEGKQIRKQTILLETWQLTFK